MRKFFCSLTFLFACTVTHAATLGNCTVQYEVENKTVTEQCSRFDQQDNNGEFGIGVREGNLVIAFIGTIQNNTGDTVNVKLTKIYVNNISEIPKTEFHQVSEGFCKFRKGNGVECESGNFMLNATY